MIEVVGGCYDEVCLSPPLQQFYGSGGRAAAALVGLHPGLRLHTYVPAANEGKARRLAAKAGFTIIPTPSAEPISFAYAHPLASSSMNPHPLAVRPAPTPIAVQGEVVLAFGMIEGLARAEAQTLVYDPQNGARPIPLHETGSTAQRLAILCNAGEAALLAGSDSPVEAGRTIRDAEGADVVVVKAGPAGAFVLSDDGLNEIPAYRSEAMFGIGSGDIFAAAFTHHWALLGLPASQAADLASRAVCHYVATRDEHLAADPAPSASPVTVVKGRVYLAAPFFTLAQRWLVEEARDQLQALGLDVFSPVHEVGFGPAEIVAPADLAGLEECDRVFAVLDGLDAGTVFEVGYARRLGLPVFAYGETIAAEDCKMITGSGCALIDDFATAIYRTAWKS